MTGRNRDRAKPAGSAAGVPDLAGLTRLRTLFLSETQVTDAGLKQLAALKGLQALHLTGTHATAKGVTMLRELMPECRITKTD